jgi:hypothetical protein
MDNKFINKEEMNVFNPEAFIIGNGYCIRHVGSDEKIFGILKNCTKFRLVFMTLRKNDDRKSKLVRLNESTHSMFIETIHAEDMDKYIIEECCQD